MTGARQKVFRLRYSPRTLGEVWDFERKIWFYSEPPKRESILGPNYLSIISHDEARSLLPPEAMTEYPWAKSFGVLGIQIVLAKQRTDYDWYMPRYEAKDPDPEPIRIYRRRSNANTNYWQKWNTNKNRWAFDLGVSKTGKALGFPLQSLGVDYAHDYLPRIAFAKDWAWSVKILPNPKQNSPDRLVENWAHEKPSSL